MDLATLANVATALTVLTGVGFGLVEAQRARRALVGGTVRLAWRKLQHYVEEERRRIGSQKSFEWFQWLAMQLDRYSPGKTNLTIGAHEVYRDWKP
jgi:hypothetical protein